MGRIEWLGAARLAFEATILRDNPEPRPSGEFIAMDVNAARPAMLSGCGFGTSCVNFKNDIVAPPAAGSDYALLARYRDGGRTDLIRVNVRSGHQVKVGTAPSRRAYLIAGTDGDAALSVGAGSSGATGIHVRHPASGDWHELEVPIPEGRLVPLALERDAGRAYFLLQKPDGNRSALVLSLSDLTWTDLTESLEPPVTRIMIDGSGIPVGAIHGEPGRARWIVRHSEAAASLGQLAGSIDTADIVLVSASRDNRRMLLQVTGGALDKGLYLYDRESGRLAFLTRTESD